jgi:hypothetical protein
MTTDIRIFRESKIQLLCCAPNLSIGEESGDLLVHGDNLLELKNLRPRVQGNP